MTQHKPTPTPWIVDGDTVVSSDGETIAHVWTESYEQNDSCFDYPSDARRIVACVNACDGIQTEELEIVADGGEILSTAFSRIKQQRDELLVAIKLAHDHMRLHIPQYKSGWNVHAVVTSVIDMVEGGTK